MDDQTASSRFSMLSKLIEQNRNDEFISIVSKEEISHLIGSQVAELLHTAIFYENIAVIQHLIISGCDVNCQNSRGQTSLALTLQHKKYLAAQCLLSHDTVEILKVNREGHSALQFCYQNDTNPPSHITLTLLEKVKSCGLTAKQRAFVIAKSGCPIGHLLMIDDGEVLGLLLDRRLTSNNFDNINNYLGDLVNRAVNLGHPSNVRALLTHGPRLDHCRKVLVDRLKKDPFEQNIRSIFRQLIDWQVFDRDFMLHISWQSLTDDLNTVQAVLDNGLDHHFRHYYGREVLARLFSNPFKGAFDLVADMSQILVNALDPSGLSALHWASSSGYYQGIVYLLEIGVDPNIRDAKNRTPLFYATYNHALVLLLNAGADLQAVDDFGKTAVSSIKGWNEYVAAHVSVLEAKKLTKKPLCDGINRHSCRNDYVKTIVRCRDEISRLKSCWIEEAGVSLHKLLVGDLNDIANYVKNEENVNKILAEIRLSFKFSIESYENMLKANLLRALEVKNKLRPKAGEFFCRIFGDVDSNHLVIQRTVSYLEYDDLVTLIKIQLSISETRDELMVT